MDLDPRIDIIVGLQRDLNDKFDDLGEKVAEHNLASSVRFVKIESTIRLRSRIGAALTVLLPALASAIYFLLRLL